MLVFSSYKNNIPKTFNLCVFSMQKLVYSGIITVHVYHIVNIVELMSFTIITTGCHLQLACTSKWCISALRWVHLLWCVIMT